jgi:hypothetical protein
MAYKIKKLKEKIKDKKISIEHLTKKEKLKLFNLYTKKEKYPKYAYFYGKAHKELLSKMDDYESSILEYINSGIMQVKAVSLTTFLPVALSPLTMLMPSGTTGLYILLSMFASGTAIFTLGTKYQLDDRREFLKLMYEKYYTNPSNKRLEEIESKKGKYLQPVFAE